MCVSPCAGEGGGGWQAEPLILKRGYQEKASVLQIKFKIFSMFVL